MHVIMWEYPWIKCKGIFDISGSIPDKSNYKSWFYIKEKPHTKETKLYIRSVDPNKCEFVVDKINTIPNEYKDSYLKIKNILFKEIKNLIFYVNDEY